MTHGENGTPAAPATATATGTGTAPGRPPTALFALAWLWVGVPMAYGLYELLLKVVQLFTGG
ncbi:MFS transporter small subunit [Streptomyces nanshensis]|uniref:Oxalate:formate antiporter n=1 Tax=Streptomyces nanshensis TaxID=518642 RepID=A0A1E7L2P4_9ACTN|nr:hypothetical protein [Streptomyces nanshensis]OEV10428.1 hypothetical protein AN218_17605 [Streptomyces nanshensis]